MTTPDFLSLTSSTPWPGVWPGVLRIRTLPSPNTSWSPSIICVFAVLLAAKLSGATPSGVGVASAQATSSLLRIHVDESNALALPVWSKCRCENARRVISDGEMSMVFSWSTRPFVTLSLKIPFSTPPLFSASLSLRPVSHSRVPLGWRMRKHEATTEAGLPSSSPVSAKALMSLTRIRPQSIAYRRTLATASAARTGSTAVSERRKGKAATRSQRFVCGVMAKRLRQRRSYSPGPGAVAKVRSNRREQTRPRSTWRLGSREFLPTIRGSLHERRCFEPGHRSLMTWNNSTRSRVAKRRDSTTTGDGVLVGTRCYTAVIERVRRVDLEKRDLP